jgi:chromosome segregation ATPase
MYDRARESAEGLAIESQRHLAKAREDLETALTENGKMQAEYEKSQEVLSDVRRELAERKEAIKDLEVSREAAIMGLAEYKEQLNSLEISLDKRTQTVNQLQADVKERDDALSKLDQHNAEINVWEKRIQESNDALSRLQDQLDESTASLRTMTNEFKMASTRSDHLELKCSRLRDYIRKVTGKCDQWEDFYDRQAEVVEGLKRANERTRQKTAELARRYQERDQIHDKERAVWTAQKCNLDFIHSQLEEELHGIANELAHVESRPVSS